MTNDLLDRVRGTDEYAAIKAFYGDRRAKRSQVPLINHINEGVAIIGALEGQTLNGSAFNPVEAACAYCIHPLFQHDDELTTVGLSYAFNEEARHRASAVLLAMEYRWRANNWLSDKVSKDPNSGTLSTRGRPDAGPVSEVRAMLIADKVQNYKDFLAHHKATHARSEELGLYFQKWLAHLSVNDAVFNILCDVARKVNRHEP